jgi:hypothetical protein
VVYPVTRSYFFAIKTGVADKRAIIYYYFEKIVKMGEYDLTWIDINIKISPIVTVL